MKLRTKAALFFGVFLLATALGVAFYVEHVVGNVFKEQAVVNLRIIAEQSESAYLSFLGSMKVRVLDWTSDNTIRQTTKALLAAPADSAERARLAKEFSAYVSEKKMPFDKTILITDLLDKNGIVIASTLPERIGKDEKGEEMEHEKVHDFDSTINSNFGEVFFGTIVVNGDEYSEPTLNMTVRLFDINESGDHQPLDAVLLVYFSNVREIAEVLGTGTSAYAGTPAVTGRQTNRALMESYQTSELYLVNNESIMVTPSRAIKDVRVKQKVDTLPVRECLENGKEINEEYDNYLGVRVLGASMCFQKEGLVVLVEIQKDEIFAPLTTLIRSTIIAVSIFFIFGILIISIFIRKPLARINDVVMVAKRVEKGDLEAQVGVRTKDELGYLASSFNTMITAVRNTQKELRASKYKVEEKKAEDEALLASLGEGMIATDKSGNIIAINRMAEKMLGLKSAEVIGKKAVDVFAALDEGGKEIPKDQRPISATPMTTATVSKNMSYHRKGDGYFPVAVTVTPVILEGKIIGSIEIFRDITKEKEIEKTREDLLSLASHQLRTPLSGTKWLIETLKRGLHGPLTAGQTEYIDELYKINERMTGLVHDMLGVLRMEGDGAQVKKESVSIKDLLTTVLETLHGAAESKRITIRLTEAVDFTAHTDPLLLRNILESLITNAINYSEPGREAVVSVEQKEGNLVFAIKDSGIGIPRDEQRQIFERFYRASNAKTFDTRGSGLGLYIASMLAKKIGARLSFESEVGKGSTFFVHLPQNTARV
ncbi:MAG: ATP-binding protein [Patescibacteria group bacterium]